APVVHPDVESSTQDDPEMPHCARRCPDVRHDVHRPSPTRLDRGAADGLLAGMDAALLDPIRPEDVVGRSKALEDRAGHEARAAATASSTLIARPASHARW